MLRKLKEEIVDSLAKVGLKVETEEIMITRKFGDLCFPCFKKAKELGKDPEELAFDLAKSLKLGKFFEKVEAKDGYLNFHLNYEEMIKEFLPKLEAKLEITQTKGKLVIDYSAPNPGKPMHVGHLRSTLLGESLARVFECLGWKVVRSNYMNDRGLHLGKLMAALELFKAPKLEELKDPERFLAKLYADFHTASEKDPQLKLKAREWVKRMDEKDEQAMKLLEKIFEISWKGFQEIYDFLKIRFDEVIRETGIVEEGKRVVNELIEKRIAFKTEEGRIKAHLKPFNLPDCTLIRSDGTALYITSDMGLMKHRYEKHNFDLCLYVVASEQKIHFKRLFKLMELAGYGYAKTCVHIPFGLFLLKGKKISSRKGAESFLKDMLEQGKKLAEAEVRKRGKVKEGIEEIARKIASASLKFAVLSVEPEKDIEFDWKRFLSFEGKTGPYLQYALVRSKSILRKAGKFEKVYISKLSQEEKILIKEMMEFEEVLNTCFKHLRVNDLCNYAYRLAKDLTEFYHKHPVLKAAQRDFRLTLLQAFIALFEKVLWILGIEPLEKM